MRRIADVWKCVGKEPARIGDRDVRLRRVRAVRTRNRVTARMQRDRYVVRRRRPESLMCGMRVIAMWSVMTAPHLRVPESAML